MHANPLLRLMRNPAGDMTGHYQDNKNLWHHGGRVAQIVVILPLEGKVNPVPSEDIQLRTFQLNIETRRTHGPVAAALPNGEINTFVIHIPTAQFEASDSRHCVCVGDAELGFLLVQIHITLQKSIASIGGSTLNTFKQQRSAV